MATGQGLFGNWLITQQHSRNKAVLAEYTSRKGEPRSEEKIQAKFSKKVNKNPKFKVHKERVKLKK
uniref:Cell growth-regulating nucleolar protein-like winged helix domain-containing protein n=1 Tax=Magallana gigas TaxID=29159 RepID=K1RK69_MAGGI